SYVTDREIIQPALRSLYDRRKEEVRARHILLTLQPNATTAESLAAYKKGNEILAELKKGTPFDLLAKQYSIDPSAKENGGDLYYFTSGMMIPDFEDAAYSLPVGQASLVRTRFGLHILQVTDRHASPGEIHCSHIMIRFPSMTPTPEDTAKAYAKAAAILDSLKQGGDFAALAKRNSGDPGSAPQGGDLGWFARRRWVIPFDEAAFKLKPGETSGIVRSPYGYHIIKCTGQRPVKTYEELKPELQQVYQQLRAESDYSSYMTRLEKSVGLVENDAPVKEFLATCDSNKTTHISGWDSTLTPDLGRSVIFRAHGQSMTLDSALSTIRQRSDFPAALLRFANFTAPLNKVKEQFVWTVAADSFAHVYPDFAGILNDYRDGVLLYSMEQENVWNKIEPNDSLLQIFYEKNKSKFVWPDRLDITEIQMASLPLAEKVLGKARSGESLERIAEEDSVRLAQPTHWTVNFDGNSDKLTKAARKTLLAMAQEFKAEPGLALNIVAHADTGKGPAATVAPKRLVTLKKYLSAVLKIDTARVRAQSEVIGPAIEGRASSPKQLKELVHTVDMTISGKQPLILSRPVSSLVPVLSDERANHADSLQPGGVSAPFKFKGVYLLVRLNGKDPSHLKSFAEAQPEVSGMYQDTESERLKDNWINSLRAKYPVQENVDVLRSAFAPPEK
ncbi:MAG: peptidylprolyl isomerase, partial [Bacteroidota bacterium]